MPSASDLCCVSACALLIACGASRSHEPPDQPPSDPGFILTVATLETVMGQTKAMRVWLTSTGYAGPITFATSGVPIEWGVSPPVPSIQLAYLATIDTAILVNVPATGPWPFGGDSLQVTATGTAGSQTAEAAISLQPPDFTTALGTGSGPHWGPWRDSTIYLPTGVGVRFGNADTVDHSFLVSGAILGMPAAFSYTPGAFSTWLLQGLGTVSIACSLHGAAEGALTIRVMTRTLNEATHY